MSRQHNIPLHSALDRIAAQEGFRSWSLLAARAPAALPAAELLARLSPGELVLAAARPGQGKTLLSLRLAVEAMKSGRPAVFFTLEYSRRDVLDRLRAIGADRALVAKLFAFDSSDAISAGYIAERLATAPGGTLVVVDYLQILDQQREKPDLTTQVRALRSFARERGMTMVLISQIDRSYDPVAKPCPDIEDVRLPNPLDLTLFDKAVFLHDGQVRFRAMA